MLSWSHASHLDLFFCILGDFNPCLFLGPCLKNSVSSTLFYAFYFPGGALPLKKKKKIIGNL
jgi:hypothetical protein